MTSLTQRLTSQLQPYNFPRNASPSVKVFFGMYMASIMASAAYCIYHFYKAYRVWSYPAAGLDDRMKMVKCSALLAEAKGKSAEAAKSLLEECEAVLTSIPMTASLRWDRERILLPLAKRYVKENPAKACQITQHLSWSYDLLVVAQSILELHPAFDGDKLNALVTRAYEIKVKEDADPALSSTSTPAQPIRDNLYFAKVFHAVGNAESAKACMREAR